MSPDTGELGEIFAQRGSLKRRVAELGHELASHLAERCDAERRAPLLISPLNGGVMFAADLSRALDQPHELELVEIVPYARARRSGRDRIGHGFTPSLDVAGRDVVLADGIVDTGLTLKYLIDDVERRKPRSLAVCVLFDRPPARLIDLPLTFTGFVAPNDLLVGYGLDHGGRHAQLADVHVLHAAADHSHLAA